MWSLLVTLLATTTNNLLTPNERGEWNTPILHPESELSPNFEMRFDIECNKYAAQQVQSDLYQSQCYKYHNQWPTSVRPRNATQ
jgi:hypothetical protein